MITLKQTFVRLGGGQKFTTNLDKSKNVNNILYKDKGYERASLITRVFS